MKTQKSVNKFLNKAGVAANKLSPAPLFVPEWQVELGKEELRNIAKGNTQLMEWREAKKQFML